MNVVFDMKLFICAASIFLTLSLVMMALVQSNRNIPTVIDIAWLISFLISVIIYFTL